MTKRRKAVDEPEERLRFVEFAIKLAQDGSRLRRLREKLGISKAAFAKQAKITARKLNGYERSGTIAGNFWLFCNDLRQTSIDPRLWNDPNYVDRFLEPDKDNQMGGEDNWYEWSGNKFRKFRRWAHRKYIEKMPDAERQKPRTRRQIKKWFDDWKKDGRPDANEIVKPKD